MFRSRSPTFYLGALCPFTLALNDRKRQKGKEQYDRTKKGNLFFIGWVCRSTCETECVL